MNASRTMVIALALLAAPTASAQFAALLTPTNSIWRYFTNGMEPGADWAAPAFDDSAWPQGRGLFGNENNYPYPIATFIPGPGQGGPLTSYFRTHFTWHSPPVAITLTGTNYVDDGCVVYLNGVEITRFNMPAGVPDYGTLAPAANPGGFPNLNGGEPVRVKMEIPLDNLTNGNANPLVSGDNVLAVEVHNNGNGSSDVVFGLSLYAGYFDFPCIPDSLSPTNRNILEGRSTTFVVILGPNCFPTPTLQWYRNVGVGEELIPGATSNTYTLTNATVFDQGAYYCRVTSSSGTVDSRQAMLIILVDDQPPRFLLATAVGPGLNTFRLTTDEPLCADLLTCGTDFSITSNWQIVQADNPSLDVRVAAIIRIAPTTYEFTTVLPRNPSKLYRITVAPFGEIGDLAGNFDPPGTYVETPFALTFQQGDATGYAGTHDAEIHSDASANTLLGALTQMKCDLDDAGFAQSLLRFDGLFGHGPKQIPPGARIVSATLALNQIDPGSAVHLHRMLVPWDQTTVTWNSLVDGVFPNTGEAVIAPDATIAFARPGGWIRLDVTASVQAWADGQPNHGWALLSTGFDGFAVNTSESGIGTAPFLSVAFEGGDPCIPSGIIGQLPATLAVCEDQTFSITIGVSNTFGLVFQWTKNGVDVPGATGMTYTVQYATPLDAGSYRLRISCESNPEISTNSSPTIVTILCPPSRPYLMEATPQLDDVTITLRFSERLNPASVQNLANYTFAPSLEVIGAVLSNGISSATATLTTAPREFFTNYTLRIANIVGNTSTPNPIDPNPTFVTLTSARVILPWNADNWLYNTNNLDATPDWKNPGFTPDPDWRTGSGLFGAESSVAILAAAPAPIATPLPPNNVAAESERRVTTYFLKSIILPALPEGARYVIGHYTDDGFIAYLDGEEIHRFAMPSGAVTFTNRSTGIPTGEATMRSFTFTATPGARTLAVELHQAGVTSADVLFGMEVRMVGGTPPSLSIAHSVSGDINLNWDADSSWRLRSAPALTGPYLDVAIPIGSMLGAFTLPNASATSGNNFYRLDYLCLP